MKKILLATIVLSCFLLGCIKDCGWGKMSKKTPALKKNDYNSCRAICENLTYYICKRTPSSDFPYWDNIGDTIMVCGYLSVNWNGDRYSFTLYDNQDNANEHAICVEVLWSDVPIPEGTDISKKCYVKGLLDFNKVNLSFGSLPMRPFIRDAYDIYFE